MSSGASPFCLRRLDARWQRWVLALLLGVTLSMSSIQARATVVERVVAIVGERAILLSDLRERAHPFLLRIQQEVPSGAQRAAAISQLYKSLIERMVDEELEQRAANRARIAVTAREVDDAITRIAGQNGLEIEQLVDEAVRSGLTERQYRNEVRRQVLEAKLLNLRLQGRVRVTDDDLRAAYRRIVLEERRKLRYTPAWIRIDAPATLTRDALAKRRALAEQVASQARDGHDFAALARLHSNDAPTRSTGGVLGEVSPGRLAREIERTAMTLDVGETSSPIRSGDAFVVLKVLSRQESSLPRFEQARDELAERVYLEKMNKARRHWLDGLRKRTHVEIRL